MIENNVQNSQSETSSMALEKNNPDMFFHQNPSPYHKKEDINETPNQKFIRQFLQCLGFQIFISFLALVSLFSDDIRMSAFDGSADLAFDIVHIILLLIFLIELILSCYSLSDYAFSFYFFLDLISSLSLLFDVSMLTGLMYQNNDSSYNLSQLAAQSRASRVATRAIRIVKLVRIIRIIKMYKAGSQAAEIKEEQKKKKMQQTLKKQEAKSGYDERSDKWSRRQTQKKTTQLRKEMSEIQKKRNIKAEAEEKKDEYEIIDSELIQKMNEKQSKISKALSDLTIKKVVVVVLLIMFLVPLFDSDNYIQKAESWDYTVINIHKLLLRPQIPLESINQLIEQTMADRSKQNALNYLILFNTPFNEFQSLLLPQYSQQRELDITRSIQQIDVAQIMSIRSGQLTLRDDLDQIYENKIYAVINYHYNNYIDALFSIAKTLFVCIVLIGMLHFFTEDINELIVIPIESMMEQVMEIARNPESAALKSFDNNQYETAIVQNAILKIGALLSLVFGSAGAQIIGSNIMKQGDVNPLIGGKKKCAIFGFCDIRNFTQITEVLQEDIMLFVNKIGEIVHSSVFRYGGSANKNIGEAFLLVWQLEDSSYKINYKTNEITWKDLDHISLMCDFSVYSFVKAIVKIHKDPTILDYRNDERLKGAFKGEYQVKMGFGIHIGWAIQGAIGSEYKIDASYLSPNVNMASRLQAATRQYGVNLLISEDLYQLLTPELQEYCRYIDRVTVKGSAKPIRLYTVDLNLENITPPADKSKKYKNAQNQLDIEIKREINMDNFKAEKRELYGAEDFIMKKKELRQVMVGSMSQEFYKRYHMGLECYLQGKWADARLHFNEANKIGKNDGPTKNLLGYMKKYDFIAPQTWSNYRPLTSK